MFPKLLLILLSILCIGTGLKENNFIRFPRNDDQPVDYSQHQLIKIFPKNYTHLNLLRKLEHEFEMDYWSPLIENKSIMTLIDPQRNDFLKLLNESSIKYDILSRNFQKIIDNERKEMIGARANFDDDFDYKNYHTMKEIEDQLNKLALQYSEKASMLSIGKTYEGRNIPAIAIGSANGKKIIIECTIHAREWISVAFGTWLSAELLTNNEQMSQFIEKYQFIIVPVLNVDGYVYTHTNNRMWRKTRSRQSTTSCIGADPNRNWDTAWCQSGSSTNPCSETYCGKAPFSEIESKNMAEFISKNSGNILAYFAMHSYGQMWMYPYGYSNKLPPNSEKLASISKAAVDAIKSIDGKNFIYGPIATTIYPASGSSIDYAYDNYNVINGFAVELRDQGTYGFILPAKQIEPVCKETWAGIKAAIQKIEELQ